MLRRSLYKSPSQLRAMVTAGRATAASLAAASARAAPGATTLELDAAATEAIRAAGAEPNFPLEPGYRHTICASVDDEVVHGIPGGRVLAPGDIVSIDSGAVAAGWNGDAAVTVVLDDPDRPEETERRRALSRVTHDALWRGVARLARARHLNEVGEAVEDHVRSQGDYGILTEYVGHGIGRSMHEAPPVFNYRVRSKGPDVRPGLVVCIEPMVVAGDPETYVAEDGWTVVTSDHAPAAHWEHTIAVHAGGIWVLTSPDGGASELEPLGIRPEPLA